MNSSLLLHCRLAFVAAAMVRSLATNRRRQTLLILALAAAMLSLALPRRVAAADADVSVGGRDGKGLLAAGIILAGTAPFWGPPLMLQDSAQLQGSFLRHPYYEGREGYLDPSGNVDHAYKPWSVIWQAEYGHDLNEGGDRISTRALLDTWARLGLDAEFTEFAGETPERPFNRFETGDFNVLLRFAQAQDIQFHTGVGGRWFRDDFETDYGVNFTYMVSAQPIQPLTTNFQLDCGRLRGEAFWHLALTAGLTFWHVEGFIGFDYLKIDSYEVFGPAGGVRLYF